LANYDIQLVNGTLTVTKAPLTVTATSSSRAYGQLDTFQTTHSGRQNNDPITGIATSAATPLSPVGTYAIIPQSHGQPAVLANYQVVLVDGTLTVTPAPLTVSVGDASRVYGHPNPTFSVTITGAQNGDGIVGTASTTATARSAIGLYTITVALHAAAGVLSNYNVQTTSGTLTIIQAPLTVTALDATRLYGAANPTLGATIQGLRNSDPIGVSASTTVTFDSSVSDYPITPHVSGPLNVLGNYNITLIPAKLHVLKAPLVVIANDATWTSGQPMPALGAHYSGFVLGQGPGVLDGTLAFTTPATATSPVGNYSVTPSGVSSTNYDVTFKPGTLTIVAGNPSGGGTSTQRGPAAAVTTLYNEILGRKPSSADLSRAVARMARGTSLRAIATSLWSSPERRRLVRQHMAPKISLNQAIADATRVEGTRRIPAGPLTHKRS
jgi:hypothetical protein